MFHVKHSDQRDENKGEIDMPQWTEDQQRVIFSQSGKLICSAAAGSGKTAVMIERIARLIRDGADPFSFLVITFTNAAAAEMKEKIRRRLLSERKDPVIAAAAEKAGSMEVCTIHSFCQHLIRQEFQIVGVDPLFQICTEVQREKLFGDAFRTACNKLRRQEDEDYLSFIRRYSPEKAKEIVIAVWQFIMSLPDPFGWLEKKTEDLPLKMEQDHPWFKTVSRMIGEKKMTLRLILRRQADMFDEYEKQEAYREVYREDQARVEALCRWADGKPDERGKPDLDFGKLPSLKNLNDRETDWKDRYQEQRKQLKKICEEIKDWINLDADQTGKEFTEIRNSLRGLRKVTEETHLAYEKNKSRACVLDFTDLEHKALAILKDESGKISVRNRYQRIFVDECQDVSSVQDALIQELAGENNTLFMVGDVKQSIYRFRLANPRLFLSRITDRGPDAGERIFLQENFRSRPEILETANTVFRDVMRKGSAEMDYTPADELKQGRQDFSGSVPVSVDLLETGEDRTRLETVADHIAEQIGELIRENKYRYRDIVILMPEVSTDGPKLAEMLRNKGIGVFFDGKGSFFEQQEIKIFRNLLMLLDNPRQDLPLLTVLVNPPFDYTEEELSYIRLKNSGRGVPFWQAFQEISEEESAFGLRCRKTREKIDKWRFLSSRTRLPDFLWYLIEDSALYAITGAGAGGRAGQKNLRNFCLQADRAAERGISSLREFLDFLTEQASGGEMQAAAALGDEDNLVRIMTMHKSKGLQFPVVFCAGLEKGLTGKSGGTVKLDEELGLCLPYKVPKWRLSRNTVADDIFEWKKKHDVKAEKICLLYVAVTRAQEKLFLVGTETDRPLWHLPSGDHRTQAASDYLDLIMPALLDQDKKSTSFTQGPKHWNIRVFDNIQQKNVETSEDIHNLMPWLKSMLSAPPVDDLWKTEPEEKRRRERENSLKKYSVTAVLQNARNRCFLEEDEQTPEEKRTPDYVERALRRYQTDSGSVFGTSVKKAGGALRGTVIHRFLSLVDLEAVRKAEKMDDQLFLSLRDHLTAEQVFTQEEASWIRPETVSGFFVSEIGRRMLASPEVHREWDFNLCIRERNMIVQGMIDCAFLEGDGWILLDYKTDHITDENAFVDEYRPQLEWYAVALRELTGKPVLESWLYALSVDKAFAVRQRTGADAVPDL